MSYMRGRNYVDSSGTHIQIWSAEGCDNWEESGWALGDDGEPCYPNAGGIRVAEEMVDELVMMRLAEMIEEGVVEWAIDRAIALHGGNIGCGPLARSASSLKEVLRQVRFNTPASVEHLRPTATSAPPYINMLVRLYNAFNARDITAATEWMRFDVDWPNGWEGGRLKGDAAVREYWIRQWAAIDPHVQPLRFDLHEMERTVVTVHQTVRDLEGDLIAEDKVKHIYTFDRENNMITRMDIEE